MNNTLRLIYLILLVICSVCSIWIFSLYNKIDLINFYHENEIHNKDLEIEKLENEILKCDSIKIKIKI